MHPHLLVVFWDMMMVFAKSIQLVFIIYIKAEPSNSIALVQCKKEGVIVCLHMSDIEIKL
eukprot:9762777-Ditylum_brightwellii.AAC.1